LAVDKKQHLFACAASQEESKEAPKLQQTDFKDQIVSQLSKLMSIYTAAGDKGKQMGYRRAISNIKAYAKPIIDADQMDEIPFVGEGIKKKVKELIEQGHMSKLDSLTQDKKLMILLELEKIWGVGP
jgi:DNA polymerase/3'-5' exonuclease PolX